MMVYLNTSSAPLHALTLALLLAACAGDDGGGGSDTDATTSTDTDATTTTTTDTDATTDTDTSETETDSEAYSCGAETVSVITDLSQIPPGFTLSPDQLLEGALGSFDGTFSWRDNDGPFTSAHAGTSSDLEMRVAYNGGEIRLTEVERNGDFPLGQDGGAPCTNSLAIGLFLDLATTDGLLNESKIDATLVTYAHGWDGENEQLLRWDLDFGSLVGTLEMNDFAFTDFTIEAFWMQITFPAEDQSAGNLIMSSIGDEGTPIEGIVGVGSVGSFSAERIP